MYQRSIIKKSPGEALQSLAAGKRLKGVAGYVKQTTATGHSLQLMQASHPTKVVEARRHNSHATHRSCKV
jgi:hypothetical protein